MTGFAQAPGNEVRCSYGSRFTCNQSGCQPLEVEGAFLLVPRLDTIRTAFPGEKPPEVRRCDESGCTPVEVIPRRSGVFLNLTTAGGGYLLKFLTNDVNGTVAPMRAGDFVEVATQFLGVWVSYGHCPSQDPPQSRRGNNPPVLSGEHGRIKPCSVNAAGWFPSVMPSPIWAARPGAPRSLAPGAPPLHPGRSGEPACRGQRSDRQAAESPGATLHAARWGERRELRAA